MRNSLIRSGVVTSAALLMLAVLIVPLTQARPNATFTVTKIADTNDGTCNADCSLREAIGAANAAPGSIVIVPAGTYVLSLAGYNEDNNATGDLDIMANMTISSATATKPTIQAGAGLSDRVMQIMTDTNVAINNVIIYNGTSNVGGGLYSLGNLTLNNVNVYSNTASWGGGLYMDGHVLTVTGGIWWLNSASILGGGLVNVAGDSSLSGTLFMSNTADRGGALYNTGNFSGTVLGRMTINNSLIVSNTAPFTTSIGAGLANDGYLTLISVTVNGNRSGGMAGGLINNSTTALTTITGSQFTSNTALTGGGGGIFNYSPLFITNTLVQSNTAINGGGINNNLGYITMTGGLIAYNIATTSNGGGVRSAPYMKLSGVTVRNNKAASSSGGGLGASGQLILVDSFVINNDSFQGGGLSTENATLDHTLVATNTATYGGGLSNGGTTSLINGSAINNNIGFLGGGVYNGGTLIVNNSALISNATTPSCLGCSNGGGIYNLNAVQLQNALIVSNTTTNGSGAGLFNAATGNVSAVNSAIISNTSGLGNGGGISNTGTVSMTNITLSGNTTNGDGGGLANNNSAYLAYVTIANNTADNNSDGVGAGGGLANTGALTLTGTIVGNNQVKTGLSADCSGTLNSADYNVLETMANCTVIGATAHNHISVDPALDLLTAMSGTWVHPLLAGSVAINNGDPALCPATDQRGVARPIGAACDIGAFESAFLTPQAITFAVLPDRALTDVAFAIAPTASSGLSVTVASLTTGVCTISNYLVTLVATGTCTLRASQSGNAVYAPAPDVDRSFAVKQTQTISFAPLPDRFVSDPSFAITATASSGLPVAFSAGGECNVNGVQVTLSGLAGTCTITATQAGDAIYVPAPDVARTFKILHPIFLPLILR